MYVSQWYQYTFYLKYTGDTTTISGNGYGNWVMTTDSGSGTSPTYGMSGDSCDNLLDCNDWRYYAEGCTLSAATGCSAAFTIEEDGGEVSGTNNTSSNEQGWQAVMVVVIVGLLLIAAGNIAYCIYMKRALAPKHNMAKMEKILATENADEIEVEMETS